MCAGHYMISAGFSCSEKDIAYYHNIHLLIVVWTNAGVFDNEPENEAIILTKIKLDSLSYVSFCRIAGYATRMENNTNSL